MTREERWILDEKYGGDFKVEGFLSDCTRLAHGEPLAYIIGSIPFLDTIIFLDSHPLIPRVETEFWAEKAIADIQKTFGVEALGAEPKIHILDLCAGSGCIGVAVLKSVKNAVVHFAEIDEEHRVTIMKNCEVNGIASDRYRIHIGNLFETNPILAQTFDFILSNPPYIDEAADTVEKSVIEHEPDKALFGGKDGFVIIQKIITSARNFLKQNGKMYVEHEPAQAIEIQGLATTAGFSCTTNADQYTVQRYSILELKK